jgi:hypothetical protein
MNNNRLLIVGRFICCATEWLLGLPQAELFGRPIHQGRMNMRNLIQRNSGAVAPGLVSMVLD